MDDVLQQLARVLEARRDADPETSYVAGLYARGTEAILRKVGEEATEVVIAGLAGEGDEALVHEVADLWFHTLVLMVHRGLEPERVLAELARRMGQSGIEEKAARR